MHSKRGDAEAHFAAYCELLFFVLRATSMLWCDGFTVLFSTPTIHAFRKLSMPSIRNARRCIPPNANFGLPNSSSRRPLKPGARSARLKVLREVIGIFSIDR